MKLDKQELVRMLRTQGDNETVDKVESQLPDEIDTDEPARHSNRSAWTAPTS